MRKPHSIPVFVLISIIVGTLLGFHFEVSISLLLSVFLACFLLCVFAFWKANRMLFQNLLFGISTFLFILLFGMLNVSLHQPKNQENHYIHHLSEEKMNFEVQIVDVLKPNLFYDNYVAEIHFLDQNPVKGKILLSISNDSLEKPLEIDQILIFHTDLQSIFKPLNPYQFDYSKYMSNKHIFKQAKIDISEAILLSNPHKSWKGKAAKIRNKISENLRDSGFAPDQIALMEAFILGQRNELSPETFMRFSEAGVVHVLAVSGLHVGIILFFLNWILKPLNFLPNGKIIRSILAVLLLWAYAYLAGMSPSILRATTMFSFLSLGLFFKRQVFTINMLCLSAIVLLIFNPNNLYEVGFQLSYSAVLSILLFYKKLMFFFPRKNKVLYYFGSLISVTLSAQLGVLPLSLFYFHQFPALFFISNLVIVPALGWILGGGVLIIILTFFTTIPGVIVKLYGLVLDLLQGFVYFIAEQSSFLFKHIYFSITLLILMSLSIGLLAAVLLLKNKMKYAILFLLSIIVLQITYIIETRNLKNIQSFYVFHQSRYTALAFQDQQKLILMSNFPENKDPIFLKSIRDAMGIQHQFKTDSIEDFYDLGKEKFLIIDSTEVWQLPEKVESLTILLRNSPKINLDRVVDSLQPQRIIADGSNFKSYVSRWNSSCENKKIPFHYTGEKGAYRYDF